MQRLDGYVATFVAGTPMFERGVYTGATPGNLVRAGVCKARRRRDTSGSSRERSASGARRARV